MKKKVAGFISCLLAAAVILTSFPLQAYAVELVSDGDILITEAVNEESVSEEAIPADGLLSEDSEEAVLTQEAEETSLLDQDEALINDTDEASDPLLYEDTAGPEDDTLSDNGFAPDREAGSKPKAEWLRADANPDTLVGSTVTYKNGALGDNVESEIFTYQNMDKSKTYRALYIYSSDGTGKDLNLSQVCEPKGYGSNNYATLTDIIMDDSIINISRAGMFENLAGLDHVRFSPNVKSFSAQMFSGCTSLKDLTIPKTLETCGQNIFWCCESLKTITFEDGIKKIPDYFAKNGDATTNSIDQILKCTLETVNIPSSVTDIGDSAFYNLRHLTTVNFTDTAHTSLAHIGGFAFAYTNLNSITLPKFSGKWTDPYDKKNHEARIEDFAFTGIENPSFTTFIVPEGVVILNDLGNNTWKYVYLPSTLKCTDRAHDYENGAFEAFNHVAEGIEAIYYNGSEDMFFNKALQVTTWRDSWKNSYRDVYKKIIFNTPAPTQASTISFTEDKTSIIKYLDDFSDGYTESFEFISGPEGHLKTVFAAKSSDTAIVEAKVTDVTGEPLRHKLLLKYHKREGHAVVNLYGGSASAQISVTIKDKDQAAEPYITGSGKAVGDAYTLHSRTSNGQIFYVIDTSTSKIPALTSLSNYEKDSKTGRYRAKSPGTGTEYRDPLVIGEDLISSAYVVHAVVIKDGLRISNELIKTLPYDDEDPMGDVIDDDLEQWGSIYNIPDGLWVPQRQLDYEGNIYTGKAVTLDDLRVYYGNKLLTYNKDYKLKYKNNTNATDASNKAKVEVKLTGDYTGSKTYDFTINTMTLSSVTITYTPANLSVKTNKGGGYTAQTPDLKIKTGKTQLKAGRDYNVTFSRDTMSWLPTVADPGNYSASIAFIGNYGGTATLANAVAVIGTNQLSMEKAAVSKIADQDISEYIDELDNVNVTPAFTVSYKGKPLSTSQYTPEFKNNKVAGTGYLIIRGTGVDVGGLSFVGSKTVPFKIKGIPMNSSNTTADLQDEYTYTGKPVDPTTFASFSLTCGKVTLLKGADYIATLKNNEKAGKASMTVEGIGIYEGKLTYDFKIAKTSLNGSTIYIYDADGKLWNKSSEEFPYTQKGVTPQFKVYDSARGVYLTSDEYSVKYINNKATASYDKKDTNGKDIAPGFVITGKGSYQDSRTVNFSIIAANISGLSMELNDIVYTDKANKFSRKVTVKDTNGVALKVKKDYTEPVYTYDEDVTVSQKSGKSSVNVIRKRGDAVDKADILPVGTVIRVTVTGTNNYYSNLFNTFTVAGNSIKNLRFTLKQTEWKYTGKEIRPGKNYIKVEEKSGKFWAEVDSAMSGSYFDIVGYSNNVNKGTAKITIKAKNGYAGTTTISFKIKAAE